MNKTSEILTKLKGRYLTINHGERYLTIEQIVEIVQEETRKELEEQVEQLRVQLAGCSVAALGGTREPAKRGDYGWSQSYQDVLELRIKFDTYKDKIIEKLEKAIDTGATNTIRMAIKLIEEKQ